MAKKRKTKAEKEAEALAKEAEKLEKEAEVIEKEAEVEEKAVEEEVKPLAYPTAEEMKQIDNPFLLKHKGKVYSEEESSYIKITLSKWLYSAKGIDKRVSELGQADFDEALKEASFIKKIPFLG